MCVTVGDETTVGAQKILSSPLLSPSWDNKVNRDRWTGKKVHVYYVCTFGGITRNEIEDTLGFISGTSKRKQVIHRKTTCGKQILAGQPKNNETKREI